ncbi:MAG TPA: 2-succinyl-5-enolpyruvyl-6-hydroxy-3-cyclohexene-1-carboxylic-acid synthase, partial [Chitinophagales bacterium]
APLVQEFSNYTDIEKHVLFDERCAAYFALGLAQQIRKPVAIFCTSGTAVLNFAPAICEAFYQQIPLIVLTADRPAELIGKGENQAINQVEIFKNYVAASYNLDEDFSDWERVNWLNVNAPIHINLPLREPLYKTVNELYEKPFLNLNVPISATLSKQDKQTISEVWQTKKRKLIICGKDHFQSVKLRYLNVLNEQEDVVVLHEPISNTAIENSIYNIDKTLSSIKNTNDFQPDLVVTIGRQFTSKRLRTFLKQNENLVHWHISLEGENWDSFNREFRVWKCTDVDFLRLLAERSRSHTSHLLTSTALSEQALDWKKLWISQQEKTTKKFDFSTSFVDFSIYEILAKHISENTIVQWGNSSPVRYSSFFKYAENIEHFSNRGTSGIDGCVSTAVGCAVANPEKNVLLVIGDISFFYDSNSLFYAPLPQNLKIIVVNNSGGNIFRLIDGQTDEALMQQYFETRHTHSAKHIADLVRISYQAEKMAENADISTSSITKSIAEFLSSKGIALLELETNGDESAKVYQSYFKQ